MGVQKLDKVQIHYLYEHLDKSLNLYSMDEEICCLTIRFEQSVLAQKDATQMQKRDTENGTIIGYCNDMGD